MTRNVRRVAGALVVAGGLLGSSACTSTASPTATTLPPATTTTIIGSKTPAKTAGATLRANLTALLTSHVYLTAVATSTAVSGGDPGPAVNAVLANGNQIGNLITASFGGTTGADFAKTWNAQPLVFVSYAQAKVKGDTAAADAAKARLTTLGTQLAAFFGSTDVYITPASLVTSDVTPYLADMLAEIDAQASKATTQYSLLVTAANFVPHLADVLSSAIAKAEPTTYPGTVTDPGTVTSSASNLRAQLTSALVSHVYLVAIATATDIGRGDVAPATATVVANTNSLANVVASIFGDVAGQQFSDSWTTHVQFFLDYAAASDANGRSTARANLATYATTFGNFVAGLTAHLSAPGVTAAFAGHVTAIEAVIDAQLAKSPTQFSVLATAASDMPAMAGTLSEAFSEQFPIRFTAA